MTGILGNFGRYFLLMRRVFSRAEKKKIYRPLITDEMINDDISSSDDMRIEYKQNNGEYPQNTQKESLSVDVTAKQVSNSNEFSVGNSVVHTPEMIAQAEDIRKLILLQKTIKRFTKKKI